MRAAAARRPRGAVGRRRAVQPAEGHGRVREVLRREARAAVRGPCAGNRGHARRADQVCPGGRRQGASALSRSGPAVRLEGGARKGDGDAGIQGRGRGPRELRDGRRDRLDRDEDELAAVRIAILAARQGWHTEELCRALAERGHEGRVLPYEALVARLGGAGPALSAAGEDLGGCAAVLARIVPAGSLEQVIFRVDALHTLEERGIPVINSPRAIDHEGCDVRAFVVGDRVVGAIERRAAGWRTNIARGGQARAITPSGPWAELALRAVRAVGADYAGVDLLPAPDGTVYVVEVNGIPGWRGLQQATSSDVAAAIVEHCLARAAAR